MDIATLGYAVDTSQVKSGTKDLDEHAKAAGHAADSAQGFADKNSKGAPEHDKATTSIRGQRQEIRALVEAASQAGGPLGDMINRSGMLYIGSLHLNPAMIATTVAIGMVTAGITKSVGAWVDFEKHTATVTNQLSVTSGASGQTAATLERLAQALAKAGTQSLPEIRDAQSDLLKFNEVSGDSFDRTMIAAQNLANSGFGTLSEAVKAIGTAFKDPATGLKAFDDAGIHLDASIVKLATDLHHSGQFAAEQAVILKALGDVTGGATAKSADSMSAAWGRLMTTFQRGLPVMGQNIADFLELRKTLDYMATGFRSSAVPDTTVKTTVTPTRAHDVTTIEQLDKFVAAQKAADTESAIMASRVKEVSNALELQAKIAGMSTDQQIAYAAAITSSANANEAAKQKFLALASAISASEITTQATAAVITQSANLKAQASAIHMSAGAAAAYVFEQQTLAQQTAKGGQITDEFRGKVHALAQELGSAAAKLSNAQWGKELADQIRTIESNLKTTTATINMSAGAAQQYSFVQQKINEALEKNRPLSEAQIANLQKQTEAMKRYGDTAAHAQFMKQVKDQADQQIASAKAEAESFNMAVGAQAAYRFEAEKVAEARTKNITLSAQEIAAIRREAQAYGEAVQRLQDLKNAKQAADAVSSAMVDGLYDVVTGAKSASQAINDLSKSLLKMVMQAMLAGQGPFAGLFGTSQSGGLFGGLLQSLFAFRFHEGGTVGQATHSSIVVPPSIVPSLPRLHDGLSADERLVVMQTGEEVKSRRQVANDRSTRSDQRSVSIYSPVTVITPDAPSFSMSRGQVSRTIGQAWQRAQRFT